MAAKLDYSKWDKEINNMSLSSRMAAAAIEARTGDKITGKSVAVERQRRGLNKDNATDKASGTDGRDVEQPATPEPTVQEMPVKEKIIAQGEQLTIEGVESPIVAGRSYKDVLNRGKPETRSNRVQCLLQPSLHTKLKNEAKNCGVSVNDLIHSILEAALE